MTFLIPEVVIEALEVAGIGAAAAAAAVVTYDTIKGELSVFQGAKTVLAATDKINEAIASIAKAPMNAQDQLEVNIYIALAEAYKTGAIEVSETEAAVQWMFNQISSTGVRGSDLAEGTFQGLFVLWSINHGHTMHAASTTTITPTKSQVIIGPTGEATTTPGGKTVTGAQADVPTTTINNTGLTTAQAAALSSGLATVQKNILQTMVGVANTLHNASAAAGDLANTAQGIANEAYKLAKDGLAADATTLTDIAKEITSIDGELTTNLTRITNIETALTQLDDDVITLQNQVASLAATATIPTTVPQAVPLPDLSTIPGYSDLANRLTSDEVEIGTLAALLTRIGAADATMTLVDLANCCAFNDAVTGPLNNLGMSNLLFDLAVLGILVGWVDALFTIFDASDTLLATAQAAESIAGWIDQITPTFLGDTSWADQLAGVSN